MIVSNVFRSSEGIRTQPRVRVEMARIDGHLVQRIKAGNAGGGPEGEPDRA